jgi:ATP-dependent NAD(P)H-hydrate dehydratase
VLAGSIATLLSWAKQAEATNAYCGGEGQPSAPLLAAYTGCLLTRRFSAAAFACRRRAMTAPDLIEAIGPVFEEFEDGAAAWAR